jgi:nucleoside-diphosphate-sugar epimerase
VARTAAAGRAAAHTPRYWLSALECTIDISKARGELGYEPVRTRAEGMDELRAAGQVGAAG